MIRPLPYIFSASLLAAFLACAFFLFPFPRQPLPFNSTVLAAAGIITDTHYAPSENLEHFDLEQLSRAHRSLDIAMYSFSDPNLAHLLIDLAHRGVHIRLYRDRIQYQSESTAALLRSVPNLQVRVKSSGRYDLMHLKSYLVDQTILRDGSANWSLSGLLHEDNYLRFTNSPSDIAAFSASFEHMWQRQDNLHVP